MPSVTRIRCSSRFELQTHDPARRQFDHEVDLLAPGSGAQVDLVTT